jgi:hypothetical protein
VPGSAAWPLHVQLFAADNSSLVVAVAVSGFSGVQRRPRTAAIISLVAGLASVVVGITYVLRIDTGPPDLTELLGGSDLD